MSVIPSDITYQQSYFMPAYDGAATLNGAISTTTAFSIPINAPTSAFPTTPEFGIQVDSEQMWVTQIVWTGQAGTSAATFTVIRGFNGSTAASHSNAAAVTMPSGGQIDPTGKVSFTDITASGDKVDIISSSTSDTLIQITTTGRDTTGVLQTETLTGNGQTAVTGAKTWGRILTVGLSVGATITAQITNSQTTMTVSGHTNFPSSGNYVVQMGKELILVAGGQGTNSWSSLTRGYLGTQATVHQSGDNVYLVPAGDVAAYDHTPVISGHTAQTGSANPVGSTPALMKLQSGDGASVSIGQIIPPVVLVYSDIAYVQTAYSDIAYVQTVYTDVG